MDNILYFTHFETEVQYFLDDLSQQLHIYGIPGTINYRYRTAETENHKIYTVSSHSGLIGALQYYNDTQIVGSKTYGKGVAQITIELSNGQLLYVTNGRYFVPTQGANGKLEWTKTIHENGFDPLEENVVVDRICDYAMDKCVARAMQVLGY